MKKLIGLLFLLFFMSCHDMIKNPLAILDNKLEEKFMDTEKLALNSEKFLKAKQFTNEYVSRVNQIMKDLYSNEKNFCQQNIHLGNMRFKKEYYKSFANTEFQADDQLIKLALANVEKIKANWTKDEDIKHDNYLFLDLAINNARENYKKDNTLGITWFRSEVIGHQFFDKYLKNGICWSLDGSNKHDPMISVLTGNSSFSEVSADQIVKGSEARKVGVAQIRLYPEQFMDALVYFKK